MYFMLNHKPRGCQETLGVVNRRPRIRGLRSWISGRPFDVEVSLPLQFGVDERYPWKDPDYIRVPVPIMSQRLLEALKKIGVDNIESYSAILKDSQGNLVSDQHCAINVIGAVAVADRGASKIGLDCPGGLINVSFDSLVIDDSKAGGLLLFRLAESASAIVVHQRVKEHLLQSGFDMLGFVEPEEWSS